FRQAALAKLAEARLRQSLQSYQTLALRRLAQLAEKTAKTGATPKLQPRPPSSRPPAHLLEAPEAAFLQRPRPSVAAFLQRPLPRGVHQGVQTVDIEQVWPELQDWAQQLEGEEPKAL
ncbi:unnamed protein product, partial [Polarella glacialis]